MTFPSADRDLLMFLASSSTAPSAPVLLTWHKYTEMREFTSLFKCNFQGSGEGRVSRKQDDEKQDMNLLSFWATEKHKSASWALRRNETACIDGHLKLLILDEIPLWYLNDFVCFLSELLLRCSSSWWRSPRPSDPASINGNKITTQRPNHWNRCRGSESSFIVVLFYTLVSVYIAHFYLFIVI